MPEWIKVCDIKSLKNGDLLDFDMEDKKILISKTKLNRGGVKPDGVAVPVSWDLHAPSSEGVRSDKTDV
jgi:hypothetical protein